MNYNIVPNLAKACEVLRLLGAAENGLSQAEIEKLAGVPRATAFRMLTTLVHEDFARKDGARYFIGRAAAQIGIKALGAISIREPAKPVLARLAQTSGETAHLAIPSGKHSLVLVVCDSPNPVHAASRPGTLADMHCSATGKIFLAFRPGGDALVGQLTLNRRTAATRMDVAALRQDLEAARAAGYAIDDEEYWDGVRCLAAPVRDSSGQVIASIGITGTASRFDANRNEEIAALVLTAAAALEQTIQHQ